MDILLALNTGVCVAFALMPTEHPTPILDAVLWGNAVVSGMMFITIRLHA